VQLANAESLARLFWFLIAFLASPTDCYSPCSVQLCSDEAAAADSPQGVTLQLRGSYFVSNVSRRNKLVCYINSSETVDDVVHCSVYTASVIDV
jgi:hypothetical protein